MEENSAGSSGEQYLENWLQNGIPNIFPSNRFVLGTKSKLDMSKLGKVTFHDMVKTENTTEYVDFMKYTK
jgi:hypothetical protein